jgi:hypothetical protein
MLHVLSKISPYYLLFYFGQYPAPLAIIPTIRFYQNRLFTLFLVGNRDLLNAHIILILSHAFLPELPKPTMLQNSPLTHLRLPAFETNMVRPGLARIILKQEKNSLCHHWGAINSFSSTFEINSTYKQ